MSTPVRDIQSLAPSAIIDLWILDCTPIGGSTYYFHAGTNDVGSSIVFQGQAYTPMPVEVDGMETSSQGKLPRPTLRVANIDSTISAVLQSSEDLIGAKVSRRRTLAKYLDAVNFAGGVNSSADPNVAWPDEVFFVEQKTAETSEVIEWQLVSSFDCQGKKIPKGVIQSTVCIWNNASICQFSVGGLCGKTLTDCKDNWNTTTGNQSFSAGASGVGRSTGSFVDDKFAVGQTVYLQGFSVSTNNGLRLVTGVNATTLGVSPGLATEIAAAGKSVTSVSPLPFGAFPGASRIR